MALNIVVLAKQGPDTHNVRADAMNADGTVNRAALPTVFNPEDLKALEMALRVKDRIEGAKVTVVTMGPPRAAEIIKDAKWRGADDGFVLSDARFAGADTLATSYAISQAVKQLGKVDLIFGGRQAIDGDTAQVGPQIAEKLNLPQVTYAEQVTVSDGKATIKRRLENGFEVVECPLPLVVTVTGSADACRPRNARLVQKYKYAVTPSELEGLDDRRKALVQSRPELLISQWGVADIEADPEQIGLKGSPTKVKTVVNVVFQAKESKRLDGGDDAGLEDLVKELITDHIIG